jgi:hypothetical protein
MQPWDGALRLEMRARLWRYQRRGIASAIGRMLNTYGRALRRAVMKGARLALTNVEPGCWCTPTKCMNVAIFQRKFATVIERCYRNQAKGRFALIRASSVLSTRVILLNCRLRFAFLAESKWRREDCARNTLPRPVILKRLATDFLVLLRAIGFGMSHERYLLPP